LSAAGSRDRWVLLVALGVDNLGSGLFLPLAVVYATRVVGLPLGVAGTVVSVGTAAGLLVPPFAGRLVDRLGPRTVVAGAQLLQATGAVAYLLAADVGGTLVAALLLAAGQQGFYSSLFALIADVSPPGPKDRSFAAVNMVRGAGFGAGALVAGLLLTAVEESGLRLAVALDGCTFVVAAALLWVFVHDRHRAGAPQPEDLHGRESVLRNRPYLALTVVTGLVALVTDFFLAGMSVFALDVLHSPAWVPGAMLAVVTALGTLLGTEAVRRTAHLGRVRAMSVGTGLYVAWTLLTAATLVVPRTWQTAWLLGSVLMLAAGSLVFGPRANALAEAAAPRSTRGRHLAAFQYAFTVAGVVAPAVVALFTVGAWVPWALLAVTTTMGMLGLRWLAPRLPVEAVVGAPEHETV
jgi:MFS family permease